MMPHLRFLRGASIALAIAATIALSPVTRGGAETPSPSSSLYVDFSSDSSQIPAGFKAIHFGAGPDPLFSIGTSSGRRGLTERHGQPEDVLYFASSPQSSLEESFSFVYTGPDSIVEPFFVNARILPKVGGFGVNLTASKPGNTSAGNEYYAYTNEGSNVELKAISGRLRTEPYFYQIGHTYRVEMLADDTSQVMSTRVYDVEFGAPLYDQSIKSVKHKLDVYPGIVNPSGGPILVTDFAFGPAGAVAIRPHSARRAFDYMNYLGFNAGAMGDAGSPASQAIQKFFPSLLISHIRVPAERRYVPTINALARFKINADLLTGNMSSIEGLRQLVGSLSVPPDAIELWNEPNNTSEGGAYDPHYASDLPVFASALKSAFPEISIWGPSFLPDQDGFPTVAKHMADALGGEITAWNSHPYSLGAPENTGYGGFISGSCGVTKNEDCGWYGATSWNDNVSAVLNPMLHGVVTEGGASYGSYPAICGHTNVSAVAQQAYLERGMLYDFKLGHTRIYPYKFIDDGKCSDGFGTYGILSRIVHGDGTLEFTPKPAYTALAYLDRLLHDDGPDAATFDSLPLRYALQNATPDIEELLLAHSDGSYRLVLWSDSALWDFNKNGIYRVGADIAPTADALTVTFAAPVDAQLFSQTPGLGTWKAGETRAGVFSVPASVSQFPTVIDIRPLAVKSAIAHKLELHQDVATPGPIETPVGAPKH